MADCNSVDIAVVGAALVGSTLAYALANSGFSVALLEQRELSPEAPDRDDTDTLSSVRTTALSLSSVRILQGLDLWESLSPQASKITGVHVSQARRFGAVRLDAREQQLDYLGAVVNNRVYQDHLLSLIWEHQNITVLSPATVTKIDQNSTSSVSIHVDGEKPLQAKLLIAVDGARSNVRDLLGIRHKHTDYDQSVVHLNVETELPNGGIAFERFTADGPLACLPIGGHLSSVICTIDSAQVDTIAGMNDTDLLAFLQTRFGYRLGRWVACGDHQIIPVHLIEATRQIQGRALLMGNAARSLHPVAGQGFNLALRDVGTLIELLQAASLVGSGRCDPGAPEPLEKFLTARASDQKSTVRFTDALARIFRGHSSTLSHLRAVGLIGLENTPFLKSRFARLAMGTSRRLPALNLGSRDRADVLTDCAVRTES